MKKVKKSGPARMRELGHKCVNVWLDPGEYAAVANVAGEEGIGLSSLLRQLAMLVIQGGDRVVYKASGNTVRSRLRRR